MHVNDFVKKVFYSVQNVWSANSKYRASGKKLPQFAENSDKTGLFHTFGGYIKKIGRIDGSLT
jgi:hypothetical protein